MKKIAAETTDGTISLINSVIEKDFFIGTIVVFVILLLLIIAFFVFLQGKNNRKALETIKESFAESQKILIKENRNLRNHNAELLKQINAKKRKE